MKIIDSNEKKETNIKDIWVIGDVQDPMYRQAINTLEVERYLQ